MYVSKEEHMTRICNWCMIAEVGQCRDPWIRTRLFRNTLNDGPLIALMNPRIPSSYTWPPRWRARKPATSRPSRAFLISRNVSRILTPLPIAFTRDAETLIKMWRIEMPCSYKSPRIKIKTFHWYSCFVNLEFSTKSVNLEQWLIFVP